MTWTLSSEQETVRQLAMKPCIIGVCTLNAKCAPCVAKRCWNALCTYLELKEKLFPKGVET